jgi:MFS family permease
MSQSESNVRRLYVITALLHTGFVGAIWLYFYRIFVTDYQIGVIDGVAFGIGFLAEIPSGALADFIGRKRLVNLGLLFISGGIYAQGFATGYWHILIGVTVFAIGLSLVSGADDALVYDSLKAEGKESRWKRIIAIKHQIIVVSGISAYLVGGILYQWNVRVPFILQATAMLVALFVGLGFKEIALGGQSEEKSLTYFRQIYDGSRHLLKRSMAMYVFIALFILGAGGAFNFGLLRPLILDKFGYFEIGQTVILTVGSIISVLALSKLESFKKYFGENKGLLILASVMTAGFLLSSLGGGLILGALVFFMINVTNNLIAPILNDAVQSRVPSSHRATSLSTVALLQNTPYVLIAPIAGIYSQNGRFTDFLMGMSGVMLFAMLFVFAYSRYSRRKANATKRK